MSSGQGYSGGRGHPQRRIPETIDRYQVLQRIGARDRGVFVEVNAHPYRLDLNGDACRLAGELGATLAISTDAHSVTDLDFMVYGVEQARRGWLEKADVLNTRSLNQVIKLLARL